MSARNEKLRRARLAAVVEGRPVPGMSRAELAAAVNAYVFNEHATVVDVDDNYIGKLERGVIRCPNPRYREALRAVLSAPSDEHLGFFTPLNVVQLVGMERGRREFLQRAAVGAGITAIAAGALVRATTTPGQAPIGLPEIERVRQAAETFSTWDNTYGGALDRGTPMTTLQWAAGLLHDTSCPDRLRGRLFSAVGYLAHTCGFMAFDDHAWDEARRVFGFGVATAEEGGDWHLRARLLGSMARLEGWVGRPDDALTLIEHAFVRSDRLTATERAMLAGIKARSLAAMGRADDALAAVGAADDEFSRRSPDDDPPWMAHYDVAQEAGDTGGALLELAAVGYPAAAGEAESRLRTSVEARPAGLARSRALSQVHLAKLAMVAGDPDEGAAIGHAALDAAGTIRSKRVWDFLHDLRSYAAVHQGRSEVDTLRERITLLAATN